MHTCVLLYPSCMCDYVVLHNDQHVIIVHNLICLRTYPSTDFQENLHIYIHISKLNQ